MKAFFLTFVLRGLLGLSLSLPLWAADNNASVLSIQQHIENAFHANTAQQRNAVPHIGVLGEVGDDGFRVSAVLESYPAHKADIRRGDRIITSDSRPFHPINSFTTTVGEPLLQSRTLTIRRGEQELEVSVFPVVENFYDSLRNATQASVLEFSTGNKIVGYVHLWGLSRNTADIWQFAQIIRDLAHCDGIILDLRDSYGFYDARHKAQFLPQGAPGEEAYRKPVAVLINGRTQGGGEELVSAIDGLERIISIGESTPGAISDDSNSGHTPEELLLFPLSEVRRDDPQFETAVTILLGVI